MKNVSFITQEQLGEQAASLEEIKNFCRISTTSDDDLLVMLLDAATLYAENQLCRTIVKKKYQYSFFCKESCNRIVLPMPPIVEIESVTADGQNLEFTQMGDIAVLHENLMNKNICIIYIAGISDQNAINGDIKLAIMSHVFSMYKERNADAAPTAIYEGKSTHKIRI